NVLFQIRMFVNYLRPLLIIDVAHLKGQYKETNLVVVDMDGNNQTVPIAFGICKEENRHAAIALAVKNEFPLAFHAMVHVNIKRFHDDLKVTAAQDAKTLFAAIQTRFDGNEASKKTQKTLLKQMYNSTNEVNTVYGVSTANTHVNLASTQVSIASTQVSTANLSDATVYAFLASQPNGSQLVHENLVQIHKDDLEKMDLKWQLALLSMRTRKFFQKTSRKITVNGSDTTGYDKSKMKCFNCHKLGHFTKEYRQSRNQDSRNKNQDSSRRTVNMEETASKAMVAIDGAGFDWSYIADDEVPTNMALMAFLDSELDLSNSGLEEFQQPEFEGYGPKTSNSVSEDISNKVKESPDAPLVKELVLYDKFKKKTIFPTVAKIEFVRPKQQENLVRKPVKYAKMYSFDDVHANCNYHQKERMGNPQLELQEKGVIDSGCSRHITENMSYLSMYEEIDGGYLLDESQVLLRVLRKNNMYSVDLNNVAPSGGLTRLFAKATLDESNLWHRRLGHINFKTMNKLFCEKKGIKREFSVTRTPQLNGVAGRKNKTLIEAAKTMLVDSKSSTTFRAEVVNTACYVQNRVLVIKPHNKTPYELFHGGTPSLSFMRPFGCHVIIFNTLDPLGKFNRKANKGLFVGYSVNSKVFRVFNSRTTIVDETLHINFLENKPNVVGSGPTWFFDIDTLTKSMNYKPVVAENQSNVSACKDRMETVHDKDYILLPLWTQDPLFSSSSKDSPSDGFKPSGEEEKKDAKDPGNEDYEVLSTKEPRVHQKKDVNVNSTNNINIVSPSDNAAGIKDNVVDKDIVYRCVDDLNMPNLEKITYSDDDEDVGAEADMTNLDSNIAVSPIPTTRIHKDHPFSVTKDQPQRFLELSVRLSKKVIQALTYPNWIEAMQDGLLQFKLQQAWTLVDLPYGYTQEDGIDYNEVFAPVARIEAIKLFLANTSFKDFVVYHMDVKSAFLYGKIEEEVYVSQPLGFQDPKFLDRVYKVEKALYGLHQAPRAWNETLSTCLLDNRFNRGQIDKTLFIKRVKGDILLVQVYVDDIIFGSTRKEMFTEFEKMMHNKFQISSIKELTFFLGLTPLETSKPLLKDENAEDVDVHLDRSMIGSFMCLTSLRPDIMFVVSLDWAFWYSKDSPFNLEAYTDSDYAGASLDKKSTTGEHVAASNCYGQVLWIQNQLLDYGYNFMNTKIFIDNESTICIVKNPVFHSKTKHIEIRHHFIRDSNEKKLIQMIKIHTDHNVRLIVLICSRLYTNDDWNEVKQLLRMEFKLTLATAKVKHVNEEAQLHAKVDGKKVVISEASIGSDLRFRDEGEEAKDKKPRRKDTELPHTSIPKEVVADKVVYEEMYDSVERAATTATGLDAERDRGIISKTQFTAILNEPSSIRTSSGSGPRRQETIRDAAAQIRFERVSKFSNDPPLSRVNTLRSGKDTLILTELMELCTQLQSRVLALETIKTHQALEIKNIKKRVKKLEKKASKRTHKLNRLYKIGSSKRIKSSDEASLGDQEDASKQGRIIDNLDVDKGVTLVAETQGRNDQDMFDTGVLVDEEIVAEKEVSTADPITTVGVEVSAAAITPIIYMDDITLAKALTALKSAKPMLKEPSVPKAKGIVMQEPKETAIRTTTVPSQTHLQAELEEDEMFVRQKEEKANIALIAKWDDVQVMLDADHELAERLQAKEQGELTIKERQKLDEKVEVKEDSNQEEPEMKMYVNIISNDEITIDAIPLATKPLIIVDWKIIKEGKISSYYIIKHNRSSKRSEEAYERVLLGDLKVMFELDIGKKRYPFTPATITEILHRKLQVDQWNEMCYQLLKLMLKQQKEK
nr:hypothetical protein [Tanacetum cinerariifolium]